MKTACIFNIQRFSIHDGPGIRTTVFFKGCPLRCAWCHNPEGLSPEPQLLRRGERCTGCGRCGNARTPAEIQARGGADICPRGALETAGEYRTAKEIAAAAARDRVFYESSGGGVTLSGGEVMAQDISFVRALLEALRADGIHTAIDTGGLAPPEAFREILPYTDLFLYDLKLISPEKHRRYTGASNEVILENLRLLAAENAAVHIRMPLIAGVNDGDDDIRAVAGFPEEIRRWIQGVSLLPYHDIGRRKTENLGMAEQERFSPPSRKRMEEIGSMLRQAGFSQVDTGRQEREESLWRDGE